MLKRSSNTSRRGGILHAVVALASIAGIGTFATLSLNSSVTTSSRWSPFNGPLTAMELRGVLLRTGLDASSLAAAGVTVQQVGTLVDNARDHLTTATEEIRAADEAFQIARRAYDAAETAVRTGQGGENGLATLTAATTALNNAAAARQLLMDEAFAAATEDLSAQTVATIQAIQTHDSRDLPTQYLVVGRSDPAWVQLRDALDHIRVTTTLEEPPQQSHLSVVETANADPAVSQAAANLALNGTPVNTAWETETLQ